MSTPVVVATNPDRGVYLDHFMEGVPSWMTEHLYVMSTLGMEIGAIIRFLSYYHEPVFALLQDTHMVHDWTEFMSDVQLHPTAYIQPRPACYAMVYRSHILRDMDIPWVGQNKEAAIHNETAVLDEYERRAVAAGYGANGRLPVLYPEMTDREALDAGRFHDGLPERRLHLRSSCGTLSKMKATFR